ncbi:MAG: hypothetical protein GWP91_07010 [Rhodobacterales bacterium]|nr:hypothetical protein [Rhodobacterales bacterium]
MTRLLLPLLIACTPSSTIVENPDRLDDVPPAQGAVNTGDLGDMNLPTLTASPPGGTFVNSQEVSLTVTASNDLSPDEGSIWYTLNGTAPVAGQSTLYTTPITLTQSAHLRAIIEINGATMGIAPTFLLLDDSLIGWSTDLPVLTLWTGGDAPDSKSEDYTAFSLTVFEPDGSGRLTLPTSANLSVRAGIKVRGSSSADAPKKPYRMETWHPTNPGNVDQDISLLGMPNEADWILLAPLTFDRALMRNALIFHLSNSIGRYAPRTRFVELFVAERGENLGTDDYVGVYVAMERIERDRDRVPITELTPTDLTLPELSGGYLFKEDRPGPGESGFYAGTAGGTFYFQQPFVSVNPSEADLAPQQGAYLTGLLDELAGALASPSFTHPTTGRHYDQIIDVDSFIDNHILNVFTKNPDAFRLSGYFHKDRDTALLAGPIWDFDRTMGCIEDSRAEDPTWWDNSNITTDCTFVFEHGFWGGLFRDPAFTEQYWDRWQALLDNELSRQTVHANIDAMASELSEAAPRNFAAWPNYPPRGGNLAGEVSLLKAWIEARHDWMNDCLTLPDPSICTGN